MTNSTLLLIQATATPFNVNSEIITSAIEKAQTEISKFCIAALFAMAALWVMGAKSFARFSVGCGRAARLYWNEQALEDAAIALTIVGYAIIKAPAAIRAALASDELSFIAVFTGSAAVLYGAAIDWAVLNASVALSASPAYANRALATVFCTEEATA